MGMLSVANVIGDNLTTSSQLSTLAQIFSLVKIRDDSKNQNRSVLNDLTGFFLLKMLFGFNKQ
jgi:hypothetical protein